MRDKEGDELVELADSTEESVAGEPNGDPEPLPVITGRTGRWVEAPNGERVFLLDKGPPTPTVPAPDAKDDSAAGLAIEGRAPLAVPDQRPSADGMALLSPVEERSEEIQQLISDAPSWPVRWGITLIFGIMLGLIWLSWLIRYPEIVRGNVSVATVSPPVRLVARVSGEVEKLFVDDGQGVGAGMPIAVLRSTLRYQDAMALDEIVDPLEESETGDASYCRPLPRLQLGELEVSYSDLSQALTEYCSFLSDSFRVQALASLEKQVDDELRLHVNLEGRQKLLEEKLRIAERERDRKRELAKSGLLSQQEQDSADAEYLQQRQEQELARGELVSSDVRVSQIRSAILEAKQRHSEQERSLRRSIRGAYHALRGSLDSWKQDHVIRAPISGNVSFFRNLAEGQFITALEPLLAVVPVNGSPIATILLDPAGAGRVAPGQRVIMRFDSYPAAQFGTVEGRVETISLVTDQPPNSGASSTYLLRVSLTKGLETSYGVQLELRQEMAGTADILTRDRRLLERIFQQLYDIATNARKAKPLKPEANSSGAKKS